MAAPHPGKAIAKDASGNQVPQQATSTPGSDFPLQTSFVPVPDAAPVPEDPPGVLPLLPLEFGGFVIHRKRHVFQGAGDHHTVVTERGFDRDVFVPDVL